MYSRDKVYGAADNIKPYVERAMTDEKLRGDIFSAFRTANELYRELMSDRDEPVRIATRVATDDDVRDKLREAIEDLRSASDRLKGKPDHSTRNTVLLLDGPHARTALQPGHRAGDAPLHQGDAQRAERGLRRRRAARTAAR